jgi:cell division ATPase FtsA
MFFLRTKKGIDKNLLLDIGTESLKSLLIEEYQDNVLIKNFSLKYLDEYDSHDSNLLFNEKAIKDCLFESGADYLNSNDNKKKKIFLTLSSGFLKSQIVYINFKFNNFINKKKEAKIFELIKINARKKIAKFFEENYGVRSQDISFVNFNILDIKVNGYKTERLAGYFCDEVEIKVMGSFLVNKYLDYLKKIFTKLNLEIEILHPLKGIVFLANNYLPTNSGLFLDIGGKKTNIFLLQEGSVESVISFDSGSEMMSYGIADRLGVSYKDARILKERYVKNDLSFESSKRMEGFLKDLSRVWFLELKELLRKNISSILPSDVYIFGGGSLVPEIQKMLSQKENWSPLDFIGAPKVELLYPAIFKDVDIPNEIKNNPQFINLILAYYARKNF